MKILDPLPGYPRYDFRVRKDYWQTTTNDLLCDAYQIIGARAHELTNGDAELIVEKLWLLEGHRVSFDVIHDWKPGHKEAFRRVANIGPATTQKNQLTKAAW